MFGVAVCYIQRNGTGLKSKMPEVVQACGELYPETLLSKIAKQIRSLGPVPYISICAEFDTLRGRGRFTSGGTTPDAASRLANQDQSMLRIVQLLPEPCRLADHQDGVIQTLPDLKVLFGSISALRPPALPSRTLRSSIILEVCASNRPNIRLPV
jgi:hypothetical protein